MQRLAIKSRYIWLFLLGIASLAIGNIWTADREMKFLDSIELNHQEYILVSRKTAFVPGYEMGVLNRKCEWEQTFYNSRSPILSAAVDREKKRIFFSTNLPDLNGTAVQIFDIATQKSTTVGYWRDYFVRLCDVEPVSGKVIAIFTKIVDTKTVFVGKTLSSRASEIRVVTAGGDSFVLDNIRRLNDCYVQNTVWFGDGNYLVNVRDWEHDLSRIWDHSGTFNFDVKGEVSLLGVIRQKVYGIRKNKGVVDIVAIDHGKLRIVRSFSKSNIEFLDILDRSVPVLMVLNKAADGTYVFNKIDP